MSDARLRVAHVMAGAAEGGAELFFERLCAAQHGAGDAVLPVIRPEPARVARLEAAGLSPAGFPFGAFLDRRTTRGVRAALRAFEPSVSVFWMNRANHLAPRGDWVSVGRLGGYYDLRYYRGRDHLVGNTRGIVTWLRTQGWRESRTHYLPNFVADYADAAPADRASIGVGSEAMLLGLGRLHTDKGFDTAIRALARVPRASLVIAGAGPERTALETLARREGVAGRVRFLGWRTDVGALLRAADVFVCSSRIEPLGNMVLEAWSASCPVVALAAQGPAELIEPGVTGRVVPLEDPGALADAISATLDDRETVATMTAAARGRFRSDFARTPVLAKWREFLTTVTV